MRSLLFVPGDSPRKLDKGLESGADALIVDLEDSVAADAKEAARGTVAEFLKRAKEVQGRPLLYVRVNGLTTGLTDADLDGVMAGGPNGIVLPKAEGGISLSHLATKIAVREAEFDLEDGVTRILPIATETAKGVFALGTMADATPRLIGITWGAEDLSADLGAETNRADDGRLAGPYLIARDLTLLAAASAQVEAVDGVFTNFRDLDGLAAECRTARRDGFSAKMAIHPAQVRVMNEAFTPSPAAVAAAERIVAAFAAAPGAGVVGLDGEMLDLPHLKRAERVLSRTRRA